MCPDEASLVGVTSRVVGCSDCVEWGAVGSEGVAGDRDDDCPLFQAEQPAIIG